MLPLKNSARKGLKLRTDPQHLVELHGADGDYFGENWLCYEGTPPHEESIGIVAVS